MALSSRLKLWEQKGGAEMMWHEAFIKEKKEEPTSPPPPLSALPGGFLKQLVRETEKETKLKEPEVKEEKAPSKLSDNLVQQFLLPDQTPPILEAEMALRNEHLVNGEQGRHSNQSDLKTSSPRRILSPDLKSPPLGGTAKKEVTSEPLKQEMTSEQLKQKQEVTSEPQKQGQEVKSGKEKVTNDAKKPNMEGKKEKQKEEKKEGVIEERLEPEGQQADTTLTEHKRKEVRDVWYEVGTVWYVHKEGFSLATQLKPDEGTPDLPAGLVRVRMETDGTLHDVMEHDIHKLNPSELDLCEDLSELQSVNECGALHTLTSRAKASLPLTHAGPNLLNFWPPLNQHGKTPRSRRGDNVWDAPPALAALVRRVYVSMVGTRRDQSVCAVGRSGTGKTTSCQAFTHTLLKQAGTAGDSISVERIQAVFTVLRSFGTELQMHQFPEANSFGIVPPTKVEEKQRASVAFTKLLVAMEKLGFSANEQRAIWHVLAGLYHLGAAGACKVGRRAFVSFDSAQVASSVLGCPRLSATQCVDGMASGLYEELFTAIVSLINRALSSQQLTLASVMVVDTPGLRNPRHKTSPAEVVSSIDQPALQVRGAEGDPRGLLWVLDEEMCEQPLQCEVSHLMGSDPVRYDLTGWFSLVQNNPSALNAISLLQNSSVGVVKALFGPRASVPPLCRGLGGVEGGSQRSLQRSGTVRKTFSGGMAAIRRHSHCISVKLQADALLNLIRRARPVFLQCVGAKTDSGGGGFDVPALRIQLHSTHILPALQLYRTGYPEHMTLSDFRCRFQALSPPVMKRYGSVFITPDERKAVEELFVELDLDRKSIVLGACRVREGGGRGLQAACMGHLARQQYRKMKVQQMAVRCVQSNIRTLRGVAKWSWWKLLCRVRPLLDVNMDDQRLRAKEDEIMALRRRLEKSERERNELRQTTDILETKVTAVSSELSDERFRGEAVCQALDMERGERLRLTRENRELQARLDQCKVTIETLEKQLEEEKQKVQSKESQAGTGTGTSWGTTIGNNLRRLEKSERERNELRQTTDILETKVTAVSSELSDERFRGEAVCQALDMERGERLRLTRENRELQARLDQCKVTIETLEKQLEEEKQKVQSKESQAGTGTGTSWGTTIESEMALQFDSELTQALEEADKERELKDKAIHESTALGAEIYTLKRTLQESLAEVVRVQQQKEELCAQIRDLSVHLRFEMEMERMKQIHLKELEDKEEELEDVHKSSQR
ncbi:unnamed protein product, partial [Coregonus sp. 'balchen']